jgi:hypothetical protein
VVAGYTRCHHPHAAAGANFPLLIQTLTVLPISLLHYLFVRPRVGRSYIQAVRVCFQTGGQQNCVPVVSCWDIYLGRSQAFCPVVRWNSRTCSSSHITRVPIILRSLAVQLVSLWRITPSRQSPAGYRARYSGTLATFSLSAPIPCQPRAVRNPAAAVRE